MAIKYLDFKNGNDSNDGSTFANRVKTITGGMTAGRHAAGDTIRLMKSEDPVSLGVSATFTDRSDTVTLSSGVTANIDLCNTAPTGVSANVTGGTSATSKQGNASMSFTVATAFTTGQIGYKTIATTDFSAYTKISFWIRVGLAQTANTLQLNLCSDAIGAVPVNSFTIAEALTVNNWRCITMDYGGSLGSSIQSISLNALSDPGSVGILLDNILACNNLTLSSLISLSSSSTALDFWPIKSISGTTIKLNQGPNHDSTLTARGFSGTTATGTCYKREPIRVSSASQQSPSRSGSAPDQFITYSGGWDETNMSTQTGLTFIDYGDANSSIINLSSQNVLAFEKLVVVNGSTGFIGGGLSQFTFNTCGAISTTNQGSTSCYGSYYNNFYAIANNGSGFSTLYASILKSCYALSNGSNGMTIGGQAIDCTSNNNGNYGFNNYSKVINCTANWNSSNGFQCDSFESRIINSSASSNLNGFVAGSGGILYLDNSGGGTITAGTGGGRIMVSRPNNNPGYGNIYEYNASSAVANVATSTVHGSATKSWSHSPTTKHFSSVPLVQPLSPIAVLASGTFTFSIWVRRTSTAVGAGILLRGKQVSGVDNDIQVNMTAAINTWEQLTITCSPTQAVPIVIELLSWCITSTGTVYFSDASVSQA